VTVDPQLFLETEATVKEKNTREGIGATEFEILTATAFEIFSRERVDVAVVEVGLGGRLDATNILEPPLAVIITKIGIDHQAFLGSTVEAIAREKGGIIKKGSRCIVDGSNAEPALSILKQLAIETGAESFHVAKGGNNNADGAGKDFEITTPAFGTQRFETFLRGNYQPSNLSCAVSALSYLSEQYPSITGATVQTGIRATKWPGRMELVDISSVIPTKQGHILVDGAHNAQAAHALAEYVDRNLRLPPSGGKSVTWVIAASQGKDVAEMLRILLHPGDSVVGVGFGQVDGMPWVSPINTRLIMESIRDIYGDEVSVLDGGGKGVLEAVGIACEIAGGGNIVVAGSL
jgi:folylpolyglutamate synthase